MKEAFDVFLQKIISRKLLAWIVATVALFLGVVTEEAWQWITGIYIGVVGVGDIVEANRK